MIFFEEKLRHVYENPPLRAITFSECEASLNEGIAAEGVFGEYNSSKSGNLYEFSQQHPPKPPSKGRQHSVSVGRACGTHWFFLTKNVVLNFTFFVNFFSEQF